MNDNCDFTAGPCACGAWHQAKDLPRRMKVLFHRRKEVTIPGHLKAVDRGMQSYHIMGRGPRMLHGRMLEMADEPATHEWLASQYEVYTDL